MELRKLLLYVAAFTLPLFAISPWQLLWKVPVGLIYAGIVTLTLLCYLRELWRDLRRRSIGGLSLIPASAYLLLVILSSLWVGLSDHWQSQHLVRLGYLVFSFGVFWLYASGVDDEQTLKGTIQIYLWGSLLACVYGLYVTIGYMFGLETGQIMGWTVPRLYGTATEAQVFGNYLISVVPLALGLVALNYRYTGRGLPWAAFAIGLLCLVMTFSAGAWAGAAVGVLPLLLMARELTKATILQVIGGILVVGICLVIIDQWIYPNYHKGFDSILVKFTGQAAPQEAQLTAHDVEMNKISIEERQWFRVAAWKMFQTHPILGVGYGNYGYMYNDYRPAGTPKLDIYVRAHNQYLEILAELGLVGIIAFGLVAAQVLLLSWRVFWETQSSELRILYFSLLGSLIALSVQGMTLGIFLHNYYWVILGLIFGTGRLNLARGHYIRGR